MISATITVERLNAEGEIIEIEVQLSGHVEYYGSHNPHERGRHIGDWEALGPDDQSFKLTPSEAERAIQALEDEL